MKVQVRLSRDERAALRSYAARFNLELGPCLRALALELLLRKPVPVSVKP